MDLSYGVDHEGQGAAAVLVVHGTEFAVLPSVEEAIAFLLSNQTTAISHWLSFAQGYYRGGARQQCYELLQALKDRASNYVSDEDISSLFTVLGCLELEMAETRHPSEWRSGVTAAARHLSKAHEVQNSNRDTKTRLSLGYAVMELMNYQSVDTDSSSDERTRVLNSVRKRIEQLLKETPNLVGGQIASGCMQAAIGAPKEALGNFSEALRERPESQGLPKLRVSIGACQLLLKDIGLARAAFQRGEALLAIGGVNSSSIRSSLDARMGQALCDMREGASGESLRKLKAIRKTDPSYAPALSHLAGVYTSKGKFSQGMYLANKALENTVHHKVMAEAHYQLGRVAHLTGKWGNARSHLEKALELWPEFVVAEFVLAKVLVKLGHPSSAIQHLEGVRRVQKAHLGSVRLLSRLYKRKAHTATAHVDRESARLEALRCFSEVCHQDDGDWESRMLWGELLVKREAGGMPSEKHLTAANKAFSEAAVICIKIKKAGGPPVPSIVMSNLGAVFHIIGGETNLMNALGSALEALRIPLEVYVTSTVVRSIPKLDSTGKVMVDEEGFEVTERKEVEERTLVGGPNRDVCQEIREALQKARSTLDQQGLSPEDPGCSPSTASGGGMVTAAYNYGRACEALSRRERAKAVYSAILDYFPNYVDATLRKGAIYSEMGSRTAISTFESVFASAVMGSGSKEGAESARIMLGMYHASGGAVELAKKQFGKVLDDSVANGGVADPMAVLAMATLYIDTAETRARQVLDRASSKTGGTVTSLDKDKAEKVKKKTLLGAADRCRSVLKKDPHNVYAACGLAAVLGKLNYLQEAYNILRELLDAAPGLPAIHINMGHVFFGCGAFSQAKSSYESALRCLFSAEGLSTRTKSSLSLSIRQSLARVHYQMKNFEAAHKEFQSLLHLSPGSRVLAFNTARAALSRHSQIRSNTGIYRIPKSAEGSAGLTSEALRSAVALNQQATRLLEYLTQPEVVRAGRKEYNGKVAATLLGAAKKSRPLLLKALMQIESLEATVNARAKAQLEAATTARKEEEERLRVLRVVEEERRQEVEMRKQASVAAEEKRMRELMAARQTQNMEPDVGDDSGAAVSKKTGGRNKKAGSRKKVSSKTREVREAEEMLAQKKAESEVRFNLAFQDESSGSDFNPAMDIGGDDEDEPDLPLEGSPVAAVVVPMVEENPEDAGAPAPSKRTPGAGVESDSH